MVAQHSAAKNKCWSIFKEKKNTIISSAARVLSFKFIFLANNKEQKNSENANPDNTKKRWLFPLDQHVPFDLLPKQQFVRRSIQIILDHLNSINATPDLIHTSTQALPPDFSLLSPDLR